MINYKTRTSMDAKNKKAKFLNQQNKIKEINKLID